jgi:hypothetical protein
LLAQLNVRAMIARRGESAMLLIKKQARRKGRDEISGLIPAADHNTGRRILKDVAWVQISIKPKTRLLLWLLLPAHDKGDPFTKVRARLPATNKTLFRLFMRFLITFARSRVSQLAPATRNFTPTWVLRSGSSVCEFLVCSQRKGSKSHAEEQNSFTQTFNATPLADALVVNRLLGLGDWKATLVALNSKTLCELNFSYRKHQKFQR